MTLRRAGVSAPDRRARWPWRPNRRSWFAGLLLASLAFAEVASAQVSDLDVALFRTRRGEDLTVVDGVVQFDSWLVRGGEDCAYEVRIKVRDSADAAILTDNWRAVLNCDEQMQAGVSQRVVETFGFAVKPGRYRVDVSVEPAGQPESARLASIDLVNLPVDAPASDLILGREVGFVDTTQSTVWTVKKGEVGIAADPYVVADAKHPNLAYYVEIYQRAESELIGDVVCVISRQDGEELVRTRLATLKGGEESRPLVGDLPLTGLPPGDYLMDVRLELDDKLVARSRSFGMAAPVQVTERAEQPSPRRSALQEYFSSLGDEELEKLFDPIVVWLSSSKDRRMFEGLTAGGKRNFLISYFEYGAPALGDEDMQALDVYLERVRYVNDRFGEEAGREEMPAWRTDRGRIYMLRGQPDEQLTRAFPRDNASPYEIWSYEVGPQYVYLFVDETRFNHYRLIFSTDPAESSLPSWQQLAGRAALTELEQYFGIRVDKWN